DATHTLPDVLTAREKSDLADATKLAARQTAEGHAANINTDRTAIRTAIRDLDAQVITQIHTDVDTLATDATVQAKRDAVTAARTTLGNDQATFVAGDKTTLDQWEVIAPDPAWQTLLDYHEALATLNELSTTVVLPANDPASLIKLMDDAENAYATALA